MAGDVTCYATWSNLALFYQDFTYSTRLVLPGQLEAGIDALTNLDSMQVTVEQLS